MITFTQGNLLEAKTEALVNTVNTVGVMGKGIALMFKQRFPKNMELYSKACKAKQVETGKVFVTESEELLGPKWIINFPTKRHWRSPSKHEWIVEGLQDLKLFIKESNVRSIAIPPLGAGNGGLPWDSVKKEIIETFSDLNEVDIQIYEPTSKYQNVTKKEGKKELTPSRALISELVRKYWVLGMECSLIEIQKLAWFLDRSVDKYSTENPLNLKFEAHIYGPYSNNLQHLINNLDGSFLHCDKQIMDASPFDVIWFDQSKEDYLDTYLKSQDVKPYIKALEHTVNLIDGFESPFGMELLSTVDWLLYKDNCEPTIDGIKEGLEDWSGGSSSGKRKLRIFNDRSIKIALEQLA